ncbi:MAG: S41 family peptidase [Firmicutes bacterium]|nr:S41 family peptidase [Bacillota bacterium]
MSKNKDYIYGLITGILVVILLNSIAKNIGLIYRYKTNAPLTFDEKTTEIKSLIDKYYAGDYTQENINEGTYHGIVSGLGDKYSKYMSADEFEEYTQDSEGRYVGIGVICTVTKNSLVKIVRIFDDSPAAEAGLQIGDIILGAGDTTYNGENYEELVDAIKGEEGTKVPLKIYRIKDGKTSSLTIDVERKTVSFPTVYHEMLDDKIGYIDITSFDDVTKEQFSSALEDLQSQDMERLIVDLRNNPGGLLTTVREIADKLVGKGYIMYMEYKDGKKDYEYSDENKIGIPIVILVNENSASASEVLAGCIKDMNEGILVGTTTYGKGVVQNLYRLRDNSGVKLTIAKYYTPSGVCINGIGIEPNVYVEDDPETPEDEQLDKAIEEIKKINYTP